MKSAYIALVASGLLATQLVAQDSTELKDQKDKVGYSIGVSIGTNLKKQNLEVNPDKVVAGLRDALTGSKTVLTEEQCQEILTAFSKEMQTKHMARMQEMAEKGKKEGETFLAENKKKDGVVTTDKGLQYKVIKTGTGPKPTASDVVKTHYRGTLIDGTEFDSSYKRNEPATFPVDGVIPGWTEALQLMPVGSKWQLFVPSELAYGERGAGADIPPNSTLIFEVELLGIEPKQ